MVQKKSVVGFRVKAADVAFNSMGTGPTVGLIDGGTTKKVGSSDDPEIIDLMGEGDLFIRVSVNAGTGAPAVAANNVVITLPTGVNPRRVFIEDGASAPKFHVASISNNVVNIGTKVAPAASTAYTFELICVM